MINEILLMIVLIIIGFITNITTEFETNLLYWITTFLLSFTIIVRRIFVSCFVLKNLR